MPEIHIRQPGFTYSTCGPFTKNKERIPYIYIYIYIYHETGDCIYIYLNELDN